MREETIKIAKFEELDEERQQKEIKNHRHINVEGSYWYEYLIDRFVSEAQDLGFYKVEHDSVTFNLHRGSYFAVDSDCVPIDVTLSIEGKEVYVECDIEKGIKKFGYFFSDFPRRSWNTSEIRLDYRLYPKGDFNISEELEGKVRDKLYNRYERLLSLCKEYYNTLSDEYEYQLSDEAVAETLKINEFEFKV